MNRPPAPPNPNLWVPKRCIGADLLVYLQQLSGAGSIAGL
jgi:hypothetical protein